MESQPGSYVPPKTVMTDQEELIVQMGTTLQSLHADKHDESKSTTYWQEFSLAMHRHEAVQLGLEKAFDEALTKGGLRGALHSITVAHLMAESKTKCRIYFGMGCIVGAALATLLLR